MRCGVIVGKRAREGGQPCGHLEEEHERHDLPTGVTVWVCRPCRQARVPWTHELPGRVAGADHRYMAPLEGGAARAREQERRAA